MEIEGQHMDKLRGALADARQFLEPATSFTSGFKVYEPDPVDHSEGANLKRRLFELASVAMRHAEVILAGERPNGSLLFDANLFNQIEEHIAAVEQVEFNAFANATEQLVREIKAQVVPGR